MKILVWSFVVLGGLAVLFQGIAYFEPTHSG